MQYKRLELIETMDALAKVLTIIDMMTSDAIYTVQDIYNDLAELALEFRRSIQESRAIVVGTAG